MSYNMLELSVIIPFAAGIFLCMIPDGVKYMAKAFALCLHAILFVCTFILFIHKPSFSYGNLILFKVDALSGFTGLFIAFFALLVAVYSCATIGQSVGRFFGYVLITLGSALAVVYANNAVILIACWGILALIMYLLVMIKEDAPAVHAAKKALIMIGVTDVFMIFGIGILWSATGMLSLDHMRISAANGLGALAFFSILTACLAKAGAWPFHSWVPDVAEYAPVSVSAYFPASLDKLLGIYLLSRISLHIFSLNSICNGVLVLLGSVTIIYAVTVALIQHDFKRLLGYHAVSQVGYMVLGIGTGTAIGIAGGMFHMLNNAIYKSCLFFSGGAVEKAAGTADLEKLGGLGKLMPITFAAFFIASLSISGVPPFNGFVSKWMIYQGVIESAKTMPVVWVVGLVAAMFGSALTVASFMKLIHAIFLGRSSEGMAGVKETSMPMYAPGIVLSLLCIVFGIGAFWLPLPCFIQPAAGSAMSYIGSWSPVQATALLCIGILVGCAIYALLSPGKMRRVSTFIGGEDVRALGRVSGTEFYATVKELPLFKIFYRKEEDGSIDIYAAGGRVMDGVFGFFRYLHNGVLPTYLVWALLGMIAGFVVLFFK